MTKEAFFQLIAYNPHPEQRLYHQSDARFKVPVCGRRFGKSTMAARDLEPHLFAPNKRFWIVGPTYDLAEREFRVIWDDLIIGQKLGLDKRVKKAYNKRSGDMHIEFPWGTVLECKSAEHPDRLVGDALDGAIMSEAAKHKHTTWERFIRPALSDKRGFASFPTTPEGYNWLHKLWQNGQNPSMPLWASWKFPSWANTVMYPGGREDDEIVDLFNNMMPEAFEQEIAAEFGSFVGKIFPEWDEQKHVGDVVYNPALPNYIAFDWGYTNPLAAVEFQVDSFDRVYVWRLHYKAFWTLDQHLDFMRNRTQPVGYKIDLCFGDAADPAAIQEVNTKLAPCIGDPNAKTNWRDGIDLIRSFMRSRQSGVLDEFGTPFETTGLIVDRSCADFIHELNNYKAKEAVKGQNVPEMGQKVQDHAIDAFRYGLVHLFRLGAQHHLSEIYSAADLVTSGSTGTFFSMNGGS